MSKYTKDKIDLHGLKSPKLIRLVDKLNVSLYYGIEDTKESIMSSKVGCGCDDGFLCEHRLQWIVDYFIDNQ